jgi:chromosome segregation ATPase
MSEKLDKIKDRINEIKREKDELKERYDYVSLQVKKETDKNSKDIDFLKNELAAIAGRTQGREEKLSDVRSFMISLQKSLAELESRQAAIRIKLDEDVKLAGRELNSQLNERMKAISTNIAGQTKEMLDKDLKDARTIKDNAGKLIEKNSNYEKQLSGLSSSVNAINKSLYELSGRYDALKNAMNEKIGDMEKQMNKELLKVKELESRLDKDVKDFEKFAGDQKSRTKEFEATVAGKIDMFSVKKENLKRDFEALSNDFKNVAGRIESLKEKDSFFDNRVKNAEMGLENVKKITEEKLARLGDEQKTFNDSVVSRLNEASDKIIARLSRNEEKTTAEIFKEDEEIKLFRAHMTQFINDFVNNYEKRFEKMKSDIDQTLVVIEQRTREQAKQSRAMIVE